ncbi:hypothetical protein CCR94_05500 [Rhodoblastus sphagnicola]|uniref:Uncharacterized protein n=1 Tax=Rhodoblastus sphagnicola TaxID=333368 RepID=A0A2S6NCS4_9HYPH|nr:hypothetical protein CCR94_05500 [Rhodoblastus sphagnicola]
MRIGAIAGVVIARRVSDEAIRVSAHRKADRFAPLAMTGGAKREFVWRPRNPFLFVKLGNFSSLQQAKYR